MKTLSIKKKLLLSLIGISVIPIMLLGLIFNVQSRKAIVSKISLFASKTVTETANHLANRFQTIEVTLDEVMVLEDVQNKLPEYEEQNPLQKNKLANKITSIIASRFVVKRYMDYFEILTDKNEYFYNYGYRIVDTSQYPIMRAKAYQKQGRTYYGVSQDGGIMISRVINQGFTLTPMGYMTMSIKENYFSEVYEGLANINDGIQIFIMTEDGEVMISNQPQYNGELGRGSSTLKRIKSQEEEYFSIQIEGESYVVAYAPVKNTNYYLACLIPYSYLNEEANRLDSLIIFVVITCVILAVILALILTKAIFSPLYKLVEVMKRAKQGELSIQLNYDKEDEIGYLADNFNDMLGRIQRLIIKLEQEEREKREAELHMLQAQINPHFLFNVLNSLKFTAMMSQSYSVSDGIDALAILLRDTISDKNEFVTLEREIKNIEHYIVIQQIRYGESFELKKDLTDTILACRIPKLLLQPIVENSIIHGFEDIDYIGEIKICGEIQRGTLTLEISDNGKGFTKENLLSIKSATYKSKKQLSSIGLHNVEQRIKLHYGEEYGFKIESYEQGTKVTIKIPYQA